MNNPLAIIIGVIIGILITLFVDDRWGSDE